MSRQQGLTRHDSEVSGAHFARGRVEQGCNHPVFTVNRHESLDAEVVGAKKRRSTTKDRIAFHKSARTPLMCCHDSTNQNAGVSAVYMYL